MEIDIQFMLQGPNSDMVESVFGSYKAMQLLGPELCEHVMQHYYAAQPPPS